jgi:hypothetical protein
MVETRAELPFTGDQVGPFRAQPGRPKRTSNYKIAPNHFNQRRTSAALGLTYDQLRHRLKKCALNAKR